MKIDTNKYSKNLNIDILLSIRKTHPVPSGNLNIIGVGVLKGTPCFVHVHRYIIFTNLPTRGGDLNGTSGDNGAENWDMRVFSPFFQYFSLKNGKQKYNKK